MHQPNWDFRILGLAWWRSCANSFNRNCRFNVYSSSRTIQLVPTHGKFAVCFETAVENTNFACVFAQSTFRPNKLIFVSACSFIFALRRFATVCPFPRLIDIAANASDKIAHSATQCEETTFDCVTHQRAWRLTFRCGGTIHHERSGSARLDACQPRVVG